MDREENRGPSAPSRPFTVQCGFAAYYANTVVVEAAHSEEACRRAIELANQSDGWKSVDDCGPTYVDALAEGQDVDPWATAGSVLSVPTEFAGQDGPGLRAALIGLLDWAAMMGGWDAEVWRVAERAVGRGSGRDESDPSTSADP